MYRKGYSKVFFEKTSTQNYFSALHRKMEEEVENMSNATISSCDFHEWVEYLSNKYYILPISIFETNIEKKIVETKVRKRNPFHNAPWEQEYYELDGVCVTFTIPFDGDPNLFDLQPNSVILMRFATQYFIEPYGENCGSFTLDFKYTNQELQNEGASMKDYVQRKFEHEFESYKSMIDSVNNDVATYNNQLADYATQLLNNRKKKADSFSAISNALQIPLKVSDNAPNTTPIQLKRIARKPLTKPETKAQPSEPYIKDSDYENINNIIFMCGTSMEKTARTYYNNQEEELRDILLAALNTHYESATGETFRKIGKTDIQIEFENKAAFIGECKIWGGERLFESAIQQVINYSTWHDAKVSVIIFNKKNQSFPPILKKITEWADANAKSYIQPKPNVWKCKYYRQDMDMDIQLTILAFDLYVDRTQFKDSRY